MNCVICGKPITGIPCNAEPVAKGKCCQRCCATVVIPTRLGIKLKNVDEKKEDVTPEAPVAEENK